MANITIIHNTSSKFYSVYRPIIIKAYDNSSDTAFLRGEILIESSINTGIFASTGILINGYESSTSTTTYEFNLMEHCRPWVGIGICPVLTTGTWMFPGDYEGRRFKLDIWAVKYAPGQYGQLYDNRNNFSVESSDFTGVATITTDEYSMNHADDYTSMDRLVLGYNNPSFNPDNMQPLTNAPNKFYDWGGGGNINEQPIIQTLNVNDFPCDAIYQPVSYDDDHTILTIHFLVRNASTGAWTMHNIPHPTNSQDSQIIRIPLNPLTLEWLYFTVHGTMLTTLVSAGGALVADRMFISVLLTDAGGGNPLNWKIPGTNNMAWRGYHLTDTDKNGKCQHKKFVFQNMKGGFDFFNCYGTHSKSISVSGEKYENHLTSGLRGFHVNQKLWNKREDVYKVITQPLNNEHAEWLEELVSSPKVWVQETIKDVQALHPEYIRPIIINDGSFEIHNTEDNVHFIEFSYTLSNPVSTQRG